MLILFLKSLTPDKCIAGQFFQWNIAAFIKHENIYDFSVEIMLISLRRVGFGLSLCFIIMQFKLYVYFTTKFHKIEDADSVATLYTDKSQLRW